ncbi:MAG: regulatory protein RecX [Treponema sp.]|uniref:regulatory protein RecX n=1 Tax=Treponema sp. TaxID=166 RepID=UPI001D86BF18|nr:regulatory protein RecX [Treponema sp.]MBS7242564.1 regulatory protein RecX [Treponema sp.]
MLIREMVQTLQGVCEITPGAGSAFFLRKEYLSLVDPERICAGAEFNDEETSDILNAALIYSAEYAAMTYLARAEHCRAALTQKLIKKNIDRKAIEPALDYLEGVRYLDDERFAGAWLRTRSIDHAEGRIRLAAELASRGVDRNAAKKALDEFFSDHDEMEICRRAYRKVRNLKSDSDKIKASLVQKGFTLKEIDAVLKEKV